jgi:hypothetical protein
MRACIVGASGKLGQYMSCAGMIDLVRAREK